MNSPAGAPAGTLGTWRPGSTPPCRDIAAPPSTFQKRRKTPSQMRRDQRRREAFFAKKHAEVKVENSVKPEMQQERSNPAKVEVEDEIELTEISDEASTNECKVGGFIKIEGEYKNPKFKSWSQIDPTEEVKIMWEAIKTESDVKGIKEIGEASATFEHCFEFWGTWEIKKPQ